MIYSTLILTLAVANGILALLLARQTGRSLGGSARVDRLHSRAGMSTACLLLAACILVARYL